MWRVMMNVDLEETEKMNCCLFQDTNWYFPVDTGMNQ